MRRTGFEMVSLDHRCQLVFFIHDDDRRSRTFVDVPFHVSVFLRFIMVVDQMSNPLRRIIMDANTRIIDMTLGDLFAAIDEHMAQQAKPVRNVYGIAGIASLFGCSNATAQRIKSSGRIDGAIVQTGRKIVVNADRAIELYNLSSNNF